MSLSALVKEHQAKQQARKEEIEKKKQEALVAANSLTSALVDHLNDGSVADRTAVPLSMVHERPVVTAARLFLVLL